MQLYNAKWGRKEGNTITCIVLLSQLV